MDLITLQKRVTTEGCFSLRQPGAILLISCYELGHQPVGIAQPLGVLEQAGYAPAALDIAVEEFDADRVKRARFIGISVPMHTALRLGVRVAELIRKTNPACHICFYGLYASINADYLLTDFADSVIGGEYETPLVALIESLDRNHEDLEVEGVSRRGRIVGPFLKRPRLPFAVSSRRNLPPLTRYARLERDGSRHVVGYVETSRGCKHMCRHCPIVPVYEGRFFLVPDDAVLQDIRQQVEAGATHLTFGDPDFLNGPGHSLRIVRAMHAEFRKLTFDFTAKIEHLLKHPAIFPELDAMGCLFLISAVESFSDLVLTHLNKGHTRADVIAALKILRDAGITLRPSLVAFTPWTALDDYAHMFDIVEANDLIYAIDPVQYSIRLLIPPGSALLGRPDQTGAMETFVESLDQAGFQYHWTHPDPHMDQLHQEITVAVEEAAKRSEDPADTFDRLRAIACRMAGREIPAGRPSARLPENRPPRMTEPWFCCAEPTKDQLGTLG